MIYLRHQAIDIDTALKAHTDYFYSVVLRKLGIPYSDRPNDIGREDFYKSCDEILDYEKSSIFNKFKDWLIDEDKIKMIISGEPTVLIDVNDLFKLFVDHSFGCGTYELYMSTPNNKKVEKLEKDVVLFFKNVSQIFNYDFLGQDKLYTSYSLTRNLEIRTCVYCNRTYTLTQTEYDKSGEKDGGRIMNPQLDHYYPQSKFPLLQISFYNLIPSCDICNSRVKNNFEFDITIHTHPYQAIKPNFHFSFRPRFAPGEYGYNVYFHAEDEEGDKAKVTAEAMLTDRIYEAHQYEIEDLIKLKEAYSNRYLDSLNHFFPGTSFDEVYRLIIGTEMLPENYHKRPFSKFKADILNELKN